MKKKVEAKIKPEVVNVKKPTMHTVKVIKNVILADRVLKMNKNPHQVSTEEKKLLKSKGCI